jgi:hypothetical protein
MRAKRLAQPKVGVAEPNRYELGLPPKKAN